MTGLIIKGIGGFYYVENAGGEVTQCRARGAFKNEGVVPCVGDMVDYTVLEDGDGIVEKIHPRKNHFIRPPVANVDLMVVVTTGAKPRPVPLVTDKFLVMAERSGTDVLICINKADRSDIKVVDEIRNSYSGVYPVIVTSAADGTGMKELEEALKGRKAAFAGPSGVGKSTLINALNPDFNLETGEISRKTKRGRHTTRHVEIFHLPSGGMIYDTPGFTSFEILESEAEELQHYFPEMEKYSGGCRYDNCVHISEPQCSVRDAVEEGLISESRYDSYCRMIDEIRNRRKY